MEREFHPIADTFPLIGGREFEKLAADIGKVGLIEPIVLHEEKILDGRNRYLACQKVGVKPRFIQYEGNDPVGFVVSLNLCRRHLNESQRAMVAARLANMKHGGDRKADQSTNSDYGVSSSEAAKKLNVSRTTLFEARHVQDHAAPELIKAVDSGQASVNAASVLVELPKEEQTQVVAKGRGEILRKVKEIRSENNVHVSNNSGENEWYTPPYITTSAYRAMGGIDLDPASSHLANQFVNAEKYFTIQDDGLKQNWHGRIWLNPPYSHPQIQQFTEMAVHKYESTEIEQATISVNNATETKWFQAILKKCSAICFLEGRVKFINKEGKNSFSPLQGQAIIYLGKRVREFATEFNSLGTVLVLWPSAER